MMQHGQIWHLASDIRCKSGGEGGRGAQGAVAGVVPETGTKRCTRSLAAGRSDQAAATESDSAPHAPSCLISMHGPTVLGSRDLASEQAPFNAMPIRP